MQGSRTLVGQLPRQVKRTRTQPHRAARFMMLVSLVIISPLILICSAVVIFQVQGWNLPGVAIYDQDVGWKSQEETATLIDEIWNQNHMISLVSSTDPGARFELSSMDLGYRVDPVSTAQKAFDIGRTTTPLLDLRAAIKGESHLLMPVLYFDEDAARETLNLLNDDLTIPAQDAQLVHREDSWSVLPGVEGQMLDFEETIRFLRENALTNMISQSGMLMMEQVSPQIIDLNSTLSDIEVVTSQAFSLSAYDPITDETFHWSVSNKMKKRWVTVDHETFQVTLSLTQENLEPLIASWETDLGDGRFLSDLPAWADVVDMWQDGQEIHATVHHSPTSYLVAPGENLVSISSKVGIPMWYILEANPRLTYSNLQTGMNLKIPSRNILLPLPVVPDKRIIVDISEQQMQVFENGIVIHTFPASTGVADSPTMTGIFQIQTHEINAFASNWDLYMPHFMGIYEAWPGFMNGIHGLPLLANGHRLWASTLGSPASYGCIILDLEAAESIYEWAEDGVVVEITH